MLVVQFQEKIAKIDTDMYKTFSIRAGSISGGKLKGFSSESVLKKGHAQKNTHGRGFIARILFFPKKVSKRMDFKIQCFPL